MATVSTSGKVAYIYDEPTDTWYPVAGNVSTSSDYDWTGDHSFAAPVSFQDVVKSKAGINNFQNPAARDAAIPTPTNGAVCFVRQSAAGVDINQIQYYTTVGWVSAYDVRYSTKTGAYTLVISDSGTIVIVNSSTDVNVTVPLNVFPLGAKIDIVRAGSGEVSIAPASSVTIRSKNSAKRLSLPYSGATLIQNAANEWLLIGDLKV
jgi:hypothetical protein